MTDPIERQDVLQICRMEFWNGADNYYPISAEGIARRVKELPSAQPEREDYTEMKREFLRMASYIDSLLVCPDEQKETLMNFISRIAADMPWTERD